MLFGQMSEPSLQFAERGKYVIVLVITGENQILSLLEELKSELDRSVLRLAQGQIGQRLAFFLDLVQLLRQVRECLTGGQKFRLHAVNKRKERILLLFQGTRPDSLRWMRLGGPVGFCQRPHALCPKSPAGKESLDLRLKAPRVLAQFCVIGP